MCPPGAVYGNAGTKRQRQIPKYAVPQSSTDCKYFFFLHVIEIEQERDCNRRQYPEVPKSSMHWRIKGP